MTEYSIESIGGNPAFEISGMASPAGLAAPLAHALRMIEKRDGFRPPFEARAREGNELRLLTTDEQAALTVGLAHALDETEPLKED